MLLPSALSLSCDQTASQSRYHYSSSLFSSTPLSPSPSPSSTSVPTLYSTCRALQSMLTSPNQLPSPPAIHATIPSFPAHSSPIKLRLRAHKTDATTAPPTTDTQSENRSTPRRRIVKRARAIPAPPAPRGPNKRRRSEDDSDEGTAGFEVRRAEEDVVAQYPSSESFEKQSTSEQEHNATHLQEQDDDDVEEPASISLPSTPKRLRLAPEILPLGLERADFRSLRIPRSNTSFGHGDEAEDEPELDFDIWSTDDDRALVELVLEKLKLTKSEWQDCARSLGRDRKSVGRRWRSLIGLGEVGLKGLGKGAGGREKNRGRVERRAGIHGSWR